MKKTILSVLVLMTALLAQAQTKIAPKLEKGFKAVYTENITINMMGQGDTKIATEEEFVVSDVTAEGAVITQTLTQVNSEADAADVMAQMVLLPVKMMQGVGVKVAVSADGEVQKVLNIDEVKTQALAAAKPLAEQLLAANPAIAAMASADDLLEQFAGALTEETLLASYKTDGVLALNGKTLMNGAQDTYTNDQGMKMKRMYFVTPKSIIANASLDMTPDELKQFIISKVEEEAPDQAEMVKQNIDMVMGSMKFEVTNKSTYELQENGWVKSIKTEGSSELMGQTSKQTSEVKLKN